MLKQFVSLAAIVLAMLSLMAYRPQEGRQLPSVEIKSLNGKPANLADITNDGMPMILLAWEVTCQPCIAEFKNIAPLYASWQAETGVKIVAVSVDDNRSSHRVGPLVKSKGWPYEIYLDPNQAFKRAMNIPACPQAYVVDGKGNVVWQKAGYVPGDETVMYEAVKKAASRSTN